MNRKPKTKKKSKKPCSRGRYATAAEQLEIAMKILRATPFYGEPATKPMS